MKPKNTLIAITAALALQSTTALAGPPNDNFTNRLALVGTNLSVMGTNTTATKETGETNHAAPFGYTASGKSVWYSWTPAGSGYAEFTLAGAFNKVLAIYTGTALTNLTGTANDYETSGYTASGWFDVTAGTEYIIAVDGYSGGSGSFTLSLVETPAPLNDAFANRIPISGTSVTTNGANLGASKEPGEPAHAGDPGGHSVWWTWTAPAGGRVTISASGGFSKAVAIYTGTELATLAPVASAAGSYSGVASTSFDVVAGVAYQIAVDGAGKYDFTTSLTLAVELQPPPANDNFANATPLTGTNVTADESANLSAMKEAGEPNHAGRSGGRSVWYSWTAPVSGHYLVQVDATFAKLLAVYTGADVASLTPVASGFGETNQVARVGFDATVGTLYHIAVDGDGGASGYFTLRLMLPPPNDDFANRLTIATTNVNVLGSNDGATKEPGEPNHAGNTGGKSVWWKWIAPAAGRALLTTSTSFGSCVGVYTGTSVSNLTTISSGTANVVFDTLPGTEYEIAVDETSGSGSITLQVRYIQAPPNDYWTNRLAVTNTATPNVFYVTGSTFGASKEPGETWQGTASVWWTWTAPTNGEVLIELESYYPATLSYPWLAIYRGTSISNLTSISPRLEFAGQQYYDDARFPVTAGTTYSLWVADRGSWGTYTLRGTFEPPPANDAFANRTVLTNTPSFLQYGATSVNAYNVSATKETGEPWHGGATYAVGGKSVWWTWTAPGSGWATVTASPVRYTFDSLVGVYTGNAVASLARITNAYTTCTDGHTVVDFPVTVGTTYQLAADGGGAHGDSGEFTFSLSVSLDTNAPAITVTNPLPGQSCASPAITVSGTASDLAGSGAFRLASGVNLVEVRLNGGAWLPATGTNTWSRALTLANGPNLIEARARDVVGNYSSLASVSATCGTFISQVKISGGVVQFTFPTESGKTYQIEWVGSLASPRNWQPVTGATVSGTGLSATCTDTNCASQPQRFYRLKAGVNSGN